MTITFDPTINGSEAIGVVVAAVGMIGTYYTLRANVASATRRHDILEQSVERLDADLSQHKLHTSESFVRRDEFDKFEERLSKLFGTFMEGLGKRMETVEHTMRNIDTKILAIIQVTNNKGRGE